MLMARAAKASNDLHEHVLADSTTSLKPEAGDTSHLATTAHEPTLDGQLAQEETKGKPAKLTILPMAYDKYLEGYNLSVVKWPAAPKQGDPEDQFMVGCFIRRQGPWKASPSLSNRLC